jgi:Cu-Zn family superoxide dismutase
MDSMRLFRLVMFLPLALAASGAIVASGVSAQTPPVPPPPPASQTVPAAPAASATVSASRTAPAATQPAASPPAASSPAAPPPSSARVALVSVTADLKDTTGATIGAVQLHQDAAGTVTLIVEGVNIPTGDHGIHIHAVGKCEGPAFASAGAHFNPGNKQHGLNNAQGHHAGDLPALKAIANKTAVYTATTTDVSLVSGATSIFDEDGSALVIHADPDDQVTDPTGNSGARIACAVIAPPRPAAPRAPSTGNSAPAGGEEVPWLLIAGVFAAALAAGGVAAYRKR